MIMKHQKIVIVLDNPPNQPSKFRTKNWVEIHDDLRGMYNTNSEINFRTLMQKSSLCDYSDVYIYKGLDIVVPMYNLIEYSDN